MRAVVQRVREADVTVEGSVTGAIERGLMVLLGVEYGDDESDARYMADKISGLRIFEDSGRKDESLRKRCLRKDSGGITIHSLRRCQKR